MNLSKILQVVINTAESGRPGAAVLILKELKVAVDTGSSDFYVNFEGNEDGLAGFAQEMAFDIEKKKLTNSVSITRIVDDSDGDFAA